MNSIPLLSVGLLLLNPILLLGFRQRNINLHKLRFWFMGTTGLAWILLLLFSITNPEVRLNFGWNSEFQLLSESGLFLDWISISLALALTAIAFYAALSQRFSPQQSVWIYSLSGVCFLAVLSDNVYTFLVFWTLIEVIWVTYSVLYQGEKVSDSRLILPIVVRLAGPLLLIYAAWTGLEESVNSSFSELGSTTGPLLAAAGIFGFGSRFTAQERFVNEELKGDLGKLLGVIPAAISIMLITRGAAIMDPSVIQPGLFTGLASLSIVLGLIGFVAYKLPWSRKLWSLGVLGLILGSALNASPVASLSWGLGLILPGSLVFLSFENKTKLAAALVMVSIGMIPIPLLPTWNGAELFSNGVYGVLFAIAAGVLIGGILLKIIQKIREDDNTSNPVPLLYVMSPAIIILTQHVIALEHKLLDFSGGILSKPFSLWIPLLLIILFFIFGERIPQLNTWRGEEKFINTMNIISGIGSGAARLVGRTVFLIISLFEGEGGLIWALILGFLLLTLITLSGGL
ncbi:MAG: hypothetical protein GQ562_06725 [Anaerolineales bacterium]|nr:hypothetical protein [Anaerolineales bacterium]